MVHVQPVGLLLVFIQLSNNLAEKQIDEGFPTLPPTASSTDNSNEMNETTTRSTESENDHMASYASSEVFFTERTGPCIQCVEENCTYNHFDCPLTKLIETNITNDDGDDGDPLIFLKPSSKLRKIPDGCSRSNEDDYKPSLDLCSGLNKDACKPSIDLIVRWSLACNDICHRYTDCCQEKDQFPEEPVKIGTCMQTFQDYDVFMIDSCPPKYENDSIKKYCENDVGDFAHDLWLITPVTDSDTGITYKNVFCATCNDKPFNKSDFWELLLVCFKKETGKKLALQKDKEQDGLLITRLHPRTKGYWKYMPKNLQENGSFCFLHPTLGAERAGISSCKQPRQSDTSSRQDDSYKQTDIANSLMPRIHQSGIYLPLLQAQIVFNLGNNDERIPRFSKCDDEGLLQKNGLYDHVCIQPNGKARCQLKLVDCPEFHNYSLSLTRFDDSRFVNYEKYVIDGTSFFVCGPEVFDSTWVEVTLNILLYLVRAAVIGLIIYLLIFLWLPAKSTLDKNLGSLGFTLVIQNVCVLYGRQEAIDSCSIVASVWHYSMLSSFTWVLILSYDCWLSLRQLFQIYQRVGEYDLLQFFIYFAVSQIIPLLVTSAALTFGSSPAYWYCEQELVLSRYECLLAEVPGFMKFFIIPAAIMLTLNIYFLVRIGCLVFPRQLYLKEVRQKFKERSGFAMMMSPTWMLGSVILLSHYEFSKCDMLIFMVHILQSGFFLIYAFKQWLGRIMQKYEDIERNIIGDSVYCPMTTSVLSTEDHRLLSVLEGRQLEPKENENLYV